jgi:hypothetical protein
MSAPSTSKVCSHGNGALTSNSDVEANLEAPRNEGNPEWSSDDVLAKSKLYNAYSKFDKPIEELNA